MDIVTRLLNATIVAPARSQRGASRGGMDKDILYYSRVIHTLCSTYLHHTYNTRTFLELSALNVDTFILMPVLNPPLIVVLYL